MVGWGQHAGRRGWGAQGVVRAHGGPNETRGRHVPTTVVLSAAFTVAANFPAGERRDGSEHRLVGARQSRRKWAAYLLYFVK